MKWKGLLALAGGLLLLPLFSWGAEPASTEKPEAGIFKPVPEGEEAPTLFTQQKETAGEVFGGRHGYVHPFLSVGGYHTSNLFNTSSDEKSDTVLTISPGIWLAVPSIRQQLLRVETLNTAPGGLAVRRFRVDTEKRFQGYALYRADIEKHDKYSEADTDDNRVEGLLHYNAPGGLSLELADIYDMNHDPYSTGNNAPGTLYQYKANWLSPSVGYRLSPKTSFRFDYTWYVLNYDDTSQDYRDRKDQLYSGYFFYRLGAKTSAFLNYEYIRVNYDTDNLNDKKENLGFVGLRWQETEKTRGSIRLGYGKVEDTATSQSHGYFTFDLQQNYQFTPKTSIYLWGTRRVNESDIEGVQDVLTNRVRLIYSQNLTAKLTGRITAYYYHDKYNGTVTEGTQTGERKDQIYGGDLALGFSPTRWLNVSAGYAYRERNSNFNNNDYRDNREFLTFTAAL